MRSVLRAGDERHDPRLTHPLRDWSVALAVGVLLFVAACAGAGYLFWTKSVRVSEGDGALADSVAYDQKLVKKVLDEYHARTARYETLGGIPPGALGENNATSTSPAAPAVAE